MTERTNLVLTGLPGCGKTTLGRACAQALGMAFFDMDEAVAARAGMDIPAIFAAGGEDLFRDLECAAAREAAGMTRTVVATGGGAVTRPDTMAALKASGFIVFIDRPPEQIAEDIRAEDRPLLAGGREALFALAARRRTLYLEWADAVLDNAGTADGAAERLLTLLRACGAGGGSDAGPAMDSRGGFAVIGDPIGHSLSPVIHRAVFEAVGEAAAYAAVRVEPGGLPAFLDAAERDGLRGFNVTIPHKRDILPLLDGCDDEARLCGAVNTVVHRDGGWLGYNTDMAGLLAALERAGSGFCGRRVAVLGTGGAAAGAALKAAREGAASVAVAGRRAAAAQALCDTVARRVPGVPVRAAEWEALGREAEACTLLINATPLGMAGFGEFPDLSFLTRLSPDAFVFDLVYGPSPTRLVAEAARRGLAAANGLDMLIYQAILADERFLGRPLDRPGLYDAARRALAAREPARAE